MISVLVLIFSIVSFSYQLDLEKLVNEFEDAVDEGADSCYTQFNLDRPKLAMIMISKQLPNDRNFKCFFHCIATHINTFDKNGNLLKDALKKYIDVGPDVESIIYNNCKAVEENDVCEKVYQITKCVHIFMSSSGKSE
ncbi:hypothetical protein FQR65_LT09975 [Abscondita terminalis]|nr:hypothetical protein FQR65_LT09975 [Abscondita terminalis]